jgi:hypothetical protein
MNAMKTPLILLLLVTAFACQKPKTEQEGQNAIISASKSSTDTSGSFKAISALCDQHLKAAMDFDTITLAKILDENAQYIGTDPKEMWGKSQIITYFHKIAMGKHKPLEINPLNRSIKIVDPFHALVTEHVINKSIGQNTATRITYHATLTDGNWIFDYVNWSLVPKNEDLRAIDSIIKK